MRYLDLPGVAALGVAATLFFGCSVTPDGSKPRGSTGTQITSPDRSMLDDLEGVWRGYLEYRDYQSDELVRLPAKAVMDAATNELVLTRSIYFTDPGYVVQSFDVVAIKGDLLSEFGFDNDDVGNATNYTIVSRDHRGVGDWTVVLERRGTDNDEPADIRLTQVMDGDTFTSTKDVRPEGEPDYAFRNLIRVERDGSEAP